MLSSASILYKTDENDNAIITVGLTQQTGKRFKELSYMIRWQLKPMYKLLLV